MALDNLSSGLTALRSAHAGEVEEAVGFLHARLGALAEAEFHATVEALCALFYVDTHDRPDLEPAVERAVEALVAVGPRAVPDLLEFMRGSDLKSHFALARVLGAIGRPALPALRRVITTEDEPWGRSFALFALGKIRDVAVREALPEVVGSLRHPDKEVRDSAARTLGKIADAWGRTSGTSGTGPTSSAWRPRRPCGT